MSPSEATNEATRREWRELGFYYETVQDPPCWRFVGSLEGLSRFVQLLDAYARDPLNDALSEHDHYGPYMYLKLQTAASPGIDGQGIRGSVRDLARLRDLVAERLQGADVGQSFFVGPEYSQDASFLLRFEVRAPDFDPASADPMLPAPAD